MQSVLSLNTGDARPGAPRGALTGIDKRPVPKISVGDPGARDGEQGGGSGVDGDFIGDRKHHGGSSQAVYAFAREELDRWERELGRGLPAGTFGENVTTTGIDVDGALIGERWRIGPTAELVVTGPRIPCATFALHIGVERWVERFSVHGRTGAYLAVAVPGTIRIGDEIVVIERPAHGFDVVALFGALRGDRPLAERILAECTPHPEVRAALERRLARR